jgi:hypothetical protein
MRQIVTGANSGKGVIITDRRLLDSLRLSPEAKARIEELERPRAPTRPIIMI